MSGKFLGEPSEELKVDKNSIQRDWEKLRQKFEREVMRPDHKVICIIHEGRQFLTVEEANDVVADILSVGKRTPIDLVLHTLGGSVLACEMIAEALVKRPNTRAFVPFYAISAGTQIALATAQVVLGKHGALGPTDIHLGGISPKDLEQLEQEVGIANLPPDLALLVIQARGAVKRDIKTVCRLINRRHVSLIDRLFGGCKLAEKLSGGELPHDHRISYKEARKLGIRVGKKLPKQMYQLVTDRRRQLKKLHELEEAIRVVTAKAQKPTNPTAGASPKQMSQQGASISNAPNV